MKEIGGFFELELKRGKEYHDNAIRLNSGRNSLQYLLKAKRPGKIYLPYYICNTLLEPVENETIEFKFYSINEQFEPIIDESVLTQDCVLLYVNYFGINDMIVNQLSTKYKNLIIDNSQAFYSLPIKGLSTFYSPRKFFGVSDGGYVYTDWHMDPLNDRDVSYDRCEHLLKRVDIDAQSSYEVYKRNENAFSTRPMKHMSRLTQAILSSIDYERTKKTRKENFRFLHKALKNINELDLSSNRVSSPMVYPLVVSKDGLKEFLIKNQIYVATYWEEVLKRVKKGSFEHKLTKYLVPLPIDQRYGVGDMNRIVDKIYELI